VSTIPASRASSISLGNLFGRSILIWAKASPFQKSSKAAFDLMAWTFLFGNAFIRTSSSPIRILRQGSSRREPAWIRILSHPSGPMHLPFAFLNPSGEPIGLRSLSIAFIISRRTTPNIPGGFFHLPMVQ